MFEMLRRLLSLAKREAVRRTIQNYQPPPFNPPPPISPDDPGVRQPGNRGRGPHRPSAAIAVLEPDDGQSQIANAIANRR